MNIITFKRAFFKLKAPAMLTRLQLDLIKLGSKVDKKQNQLWITGPLERISNNLGIIEKRDCETLQSLIQENIGRATPYLDDYSIHRPAGT